MKHIIIILSIFLFSLFACSSNDKVQAEKSKDNKQSTYAQNAPIPYLPNKDDNLYYNNDIKPMEYSEESLRDFEKIKTYPPIIALRHALTDYLEGKNKSDYFESGAIGDELSVEYNNGLIAFDRDYYGNKFLALEFQNSGDELNITILPNKKPDIIFIAVMKNYGTDDKPAFKLRRFFKSFHTDSDIHIARNQTRQLLKDDKYLF